MRKRLCRIIDDFLIVCASLLLIFLSAASRLVIVKTKLNLGQKLRNECDVLTHFYGPSPLPLNDPGGVLTML